MNINPKNLYVHIYCEKCGYVAMGAKRIHFAIPANWVCKTPECSGPLSAVVMLESKRKGKRYLRTGPNGMWVFVPVEKAGYRYGRLYQKVESPSD